MSAKNISRLRTAFLPAAVLILGLLVTGVSRGGEPDVEIEKAVARGMEFHELVGKFRMTASEDGLGSLGRFADSVVMKKIETEVAPAFVGEECQITDFFRGSMNWLGSFGLRSGVCALYNPWADGLMLILVQDGEDGLKVRDFRLLSGECWRGEPVGEKTIFSWASRAESFPLAAARVVHETRKLFESRFPLGAKVDFPSEEVERLASDSALALYPLKIRLLKRTMMFQELLGRYKTDEKIRSRIDGFTRLMSEPDVAAAVGKSPHFSGVQILKALPRLPLAIRKELKPVFYLSANNTAMVAFNSESCPSLYVNSIFDITKPGMDGTRLSLIDFDMSRELLEVAGKAGRGE